MLSRVVKTTVSTRSNIKSIIGSRRAVSFLNTHCIQNKNRKNIGFISPIQNNYAFQGRSPYEHPEELKDYENSSKMDTANHVFKTLGNDVNRLLAIYIEPTVYIPDPTYVSPEPIEYLRAVRVRGGHISAVLLERTNDSFEIIPGTAVSKIPKDALSTSKAPPILLPDGTLLINQDFESDAEYENSEEVWKGLVLGALPGPKKLMLNKGVRPHVIYLVLDEVNVDIEDILKNIEKQEKEDLTYNRKKGACAQAVLKALGLIALEEPLTTQAALMHMVLTLLKDKIARSSFRDAAAKSRVSYHPDKVYEAREESKLTDQRECTSLSSGQAKVSTKLNI